MDSGADGENDQVEQKSVARIRLAKRVMMDRAAELLHPDSTISRITG